MGTITQPLKWHGGKHYLAKRQCSAEVFAGTRSVTAMAVAVTFAEAPTGIGVQKV